MNYIIIYDKNVFRDWQSLLENDKITYVIDNITTTFNLFVFKAKYSRLNKVVVDINEFKNICFKSKDVR